MAKQCDVMDVEDVVEPFASGITASTSVSPPRPPSRAIHGDEKSQLSWDLGNTLKDTMRLQMESLNSELQHQFKILSHDLKQAMRDEMRRNLGSKKSRLDQEDGLSPPDSNDEGWPSDRVGRRSVVSPQVHPIGSGERQDMKRVSTNSHIANQVRPVKKFRDAEFDEFLFGEDRLMKCASAVRDPGRGPLPPQTDCLVLEAASPSSGGDADAAAEAAGWGLPNKPDRFLEADDQCPPPGCANGLAPNGLAPNGLTEGSRLGLMKGAMVKVNSMNALGADWLPKAEKDADKAAEPTRGQSRKQRNPTMAERAMGIAPSRYLPNLMDDKSEMRKRVALLVRSNTFEACISILIVLSAAHIGFQTDHMARNMLDKAPMIFRVPDLIFLILFTCELGLRLFAFRGDFFSMYGWGWNVFDSVLISMQLIEETLTVIVTQNGFGGMYGSADVLRVVRVLRTIRAVRVLHVMKFASDLQMLVSCVMQSFRAFFWSLGLVMMVLYVFGVYLTQLVTQKRLSNPDHEYPELLLWFRSLPIAVLSLFQALTGGCDWKEIVNPLMEDISVYMGLFFPIFIAFNLILVLNVVSATFVESAHHRAGKVRDMQKMAHASRLFKTLDTDGSGFITLDELLSASEEKEVQDFFRSIDVDVSEAQYLFEMIDTDHSGQIEFTEFFSGCLRLQGTAKSMDMVMAFHSLNRNLEKIQVMLSLPLGNTGLVNTGLGTTGGLVTTGSSSLLSQQGGLTALGDTIKSVNLQ